MSRDRDPAGRHPLCTCPELTWDALTGRAPAPDLDACRARAFGGIDPHPAVELAEATSVINELDRIRGRRD